MPTLPTYLDFDLSIRKEGTQYRADILNSPGGEGTVAFTLPFSELELENLFLRMGRTRKNVRGMDSPEMQAAKQFGGKLFDTVFASYIGTTFRTSIDQATRQDAGLRLRLRLDDAPDLVDLPWEFLYNSALNRFLTLYNKTPLVRYIALPETPRPLKITPPLNILVLISSPTDYPPLDVEAEWNKLQTALAELITRGLVTLERLDTASLDALRRKLRQGQYHVLHFIGHGGIDGQTQDGVLILEDAQQKGRLTSGQYLANVLSNHDAMRLVVLNACEGARTTRADPFSGVAQSLVQQGIPAVIAMQFEITDSASLVFAQEFYTALADGYPVDAALGEARGAIFAQPNDLEWATPVLYSRAPDGVIFDVQPNTSTAWSAPEPLSTKAKPKPQPLAPVRTNLAQEFNPIGKWDIQVQDLVGSRLFIEIQANGTFQMQQQVGMYQVPVNGSWTWNPAARQLALQGVVNTFQPFILDLTIGNRLPNGFTATGGDGIGYILTRSM